MYGGMNTADFDILKGLENGSYICGSTRITEEKLRTYLYVTDKTIATNAIYKNQDNFYLVAVDKAPVGRYGYVKTP